MSKPIGYTFGDVFDRATSQKPKPVMRLTPKQRAVQRDIEVTRKAVRDNEKKLDALMKGCTHPVFRDEAGFMYDDRTCVICGVHIESL